MTLQEFGRPGATERRCCGRPSFARLRAVRLILAALLLSHHDMRAADVRPYEPAVVSLPVSIAETQAEISAILLLPTGQIRTNGFAPDTCLATYVETNGSRSCLCVIFDNAGPRTDIFTSTGQYKIVVANLTNTFNVVQPSSMEQSAYPFVRSNTLAQVLFITAPTDLTDAMKTNAQQILAVVTNGPYSDYARTSLALDAFYAPKLNPLDVVAQGGRDFSSVVAQFDSFTVTNGLLRTTYLYYKGLANMYAKRGPDAIATWCGLLNEFQSGLQSRVASNQLQRIFNGCVAWYPLNEGSGSLTKDLVCNGSDGLFKGSSPPTWTSGIESNGLAFDGSGNGYVEVGTNSALAAVSNKLSIAAWVKTAASSSGAIVSRTATNGASGSYVLSLSAGQPRLKLFLGGTAQILTGTNTIADTKWHFIVGAYDSTQMLVYLDGARAGSLTITNSINGGAWPLWIGKDASGSAITGRVDNVQIFHRALSASDVTDYYQMDSDADGLSNADELNIYGTDPAKADTDSDGLSDGDEIIIHHTNPNTADSDGDGTSDYAEIWDRGTDPTNSASLNITLYANSVTGSNFYDGASATVTNGHGPKLAIQGAVGVAVSNDTIQIAGDQAGYAESTLNPGAKSLTVRPAGTVTVTP